MRTDCRRLPSASRALAVQRHPIVQQTLLWAGGCSRPRRGQSGVGLRRGRDPRPVRRFVADSMFVVSRGKGPVPLQPVDAALDGVPGVVVLRGSNFGGRPPPGPGVRRRHPYRAPSVHQGAWSAALSGSTTCSVPLLLPRLLPSSRTSLVPLWGSRTAAACRVAAAQAWHASARRQMRRHALRVSSSAIGPSQPRCR